MKFCIGSGLQLQNMTTDKQVCREYIVSHSVHSFVSVFINLTTFLQFTSKLCVKYFYFLIFHLLYDISIALALLSSI